MLRQAQEESRLEEQERRSLQVIDQMRKQVEEFEDLLQQDRAAPSRAVTPEAPNASLSREPAVAAAAAAAARSEVPQ
eukprot:1396808-Alexandrium_andersonii.AAC.1